MNCSVRKRLDAAHASGNALPQVDLECHLQMRDHLCQIPAAQCGTIEACAHASARNGSRPNDSGQTRRIHHFVEEFTSRFAVGGHLETATMTRSFRHSTVLLVRNRNDTLRL